MEPESNNPSGKRKKWKQKKQKKGQLHNGETEAEPFKGNRTGWETSGVNKEAERGGFQRPRSGRSFGGF